MKPDDPNRRFVYEPGDITFYRNGKPIEMPMKVPGYDKLQIWRDGKLMDAPEEVLRIAERKSE